MLALLAALSACDEKKLPGVGSSDALADATAAEVLAADTVVAEVAVADVGAVMPPLQEVTAPRFDPAKTPRTPQQKASHQEKIKNGEPFDALELMPAVKVASQQVADEVVVGKTSLKLPLKGNEALLELEPNDVMTGAAGNAAGRLASGGNNVFGFMRKVKSVKVVGDSIEIETASAKLNEVFAGAVYLSADLTQAADIDVAGVDLREYFPGLAKDYVPQPKASPKSKGGFEQANGPWGLDKLVGFQFKVGGEHTFPIDLESYVNGVALSVDGEFKVKAEAGMEAGLGYGFDVDTPFPNFWDSSLNYVRIWVGGGFNAEAGFWLAAKTQGDGAGEALEKALEIAQIDNPFKPSIPDSYTLGTFGPKAGPTLVVVPTTYYIEMVATCTTKVSSSIKAGASAGVKGEIKFGYEYTKADSFQPIKIMEFKKWQEFDVSDGKLTGVLECMIGPKIHWLIAGIAGPYIDGRVGARGTLTYDATCKPPAQLAQPGKPAASLAAMLEIGIRVALGGSLELAYKGETLWEYDFGSVNLIDQWWTLWSKSWYVGDGLTNCPSDCANGIKDNDESDVDCGGGKCKACPPGSVCQSSNDCPYKFNCTYGECSTLDAKDPCNDGKLGSTETDVDCGGKCGKCKYGQKCTKGDQCASNTCASDSGTCSSYDCKNGLYDPYGETDIDCGGNCKGPQNNNKTCGAGKKCVWDDDCQSGKCMWFKDEGKAVTAICVPKECSSLENTVADGYETGKNCGGQCSAYIDIKYDVCIKGLCGKDILKCPIGQGCKVHADCQTDNCELGTGVCLPPRCQDGIQDFGESDIDCGGPCIAKCDNLKACNSNADCIDCSGVCPEGAPLTCNKWNGTGFDGLLLCRKFYENGLLDAKLEPSIDCGGKTPKPCKAMDFCYMNYDCGPGHECVPTLFGAKRCMPWGTCSDGKLSGGEPDIDCGKGCANPYSGLGYCKEGQHCSVNADCASGKCSGFQQDKVGEGVLGTCMAVCENGKQDSGEADVDCGGPKCKNKCADGKWCQNKSHCASNLCSPVTWHCQASSCSDGYWGGVESDLDCGGECAAKCAAGKKCLGNGDCASDDCQGNVCIPMPCENGVLDLGEIDVDCGGNCQQKCADGKKCMVSGLAVDFNAYCKSGICQKKTGTCGTDLCQDKKLSGKETDVDCGGTCPDKCSKTQGCATGKDCKSGWCDGSVCVATHCDDKQWQPQYESDLDCGGYNCLDTQCGSNGCTTAKTLCSVGQKCWGGSDCASGFCDGQFCVATSCEDKKKSGDELGIDCAGSCAAKCPNGSGCNKAADCASNVCGAWAQCVAGSCFDGKKTDDESDADCGGACTAKCSTGKLCAQEADCASGLCSAKNGCVTSPCDDGKLSAGEADVDCGGTCKTACLIGAGCKQDGDCFSGWCGTASKVCVSTCFNSKQDDNETDVDCGGACAAGCAVGAKCALGGDCGSGSCGAVSGLCVASACLDQKQGGNESDVDCGGTCGATCVLGAGCASAGDCAAQVCAVAGKCVATTCEDGKQDGGESDLDCGGPCALKCATGKLCGLDGDCSSSFCNAKTGCVASACDDGKLDGDETDLDCGGSCKADCVVGGKCKGGADCASSVCAVKALVCVATTCADEKKDGDESDVDCGGGCAAKCAIGGACGLGGDCGSKICAVAGKCVGSTCEDGKQDGDETALDCGGSCTAKCAVDLPCKVTADCATNFCSGAGKCGCPVAQYWLSAGQKCQDCGCAAPGSAGSGCDGNGACACKPGWGGATCGAKVDVCLADQLDCDDKNVCTKDSCDPKTGCGHAADAGLDGTSCDDGDACTTGSTCKTGACAAGNSVQCQDDGNACTLETCDKADGKCKTALKVCDDANPCSDDACDPVKGCVAVNNTAPCEYGCVDGKNCKSGTCGGGKCMSSCEISGLGGLPIIRAGKETSAVAAGDLDGDGIADLASASANPGTVGVHIGLGDGTFKPMVTYAATAGAAGLVMALLDGDSKPDLVVGAGTGVMVYLNTGDGTFKPAVSYETPVEVRAIAVADLNGDKFADLAVVAPNANTLSVLFGKGDGSFEPRVDYAVLGFLTNNVNVADVNGDKAPDLVLAGAYTPKIAVLLNDGKGAFTLVAYDPPTDQYRRITVGDFNGDNKVDYAVTTSNAVKILLGAGDGSFNAGAAHVVTNLPTAIRSQDLDGDGKLDLVAALLNNTVAVLIGNGDGTFKAAVEYAADSHPQDLALADFNGDQKPDLAVANQMGTVTVLLNLGDATFKAKKLLVAHTSPRGVVIADLNGDLKPDIATAAMGNAGVSVHLNQGNGAYALRVIYATGAAPYALVAVDVDGDKKLDLVAPNSGANNVTVRKGAGDGTFPTKFDYPTGTAPKAVVAANIDGDDKPDLVVSNSTATTISYLANAGDGTFKAKVDIEVGGKANWTSAGDFNGDSKTDLAVGVMSNQIAVLFGNGDGSFGAPQMYTVAYYPRAIAVAQLDGDGKPDLAIACEGNSVVSVLLNKGDGTFKAKTDYAAGAWAYSIAAADMDADGMLDLVVANPGDNSLTLLAGKGDGTFKAAVNYATAGPAWAVAAGDLDADGKPDLATVIIDTTLGWGHFVVVLMNACLNKP